MQLRTCQKTRGLTSLRHQGKAPREGLPLTASRIDPAEYSEERIHRLLAQAGWTATNGQEWLNAWKP